MNVTVKEMSTKEILERLESRTQERLGVSAQQFIEQYEQGKLECPGAYADMLALVRLIPKNNAIFARR